MNILSDVTEISRRNFIKGSSASALAMTLGGMALTSSTKLLAQEELGEGAVLKIGLIGCGYHGRELLQELAKLESAKVTAICDTYPAYLRRGARLAPDAESFEDYKDLLKSDNVEAVIVATPTHQHVQIVLDAIAAKKHVYCEAPIAHSLEDARTIAKAARKGLAVHFQAGLQFRSDPQRAFVLEFVRTGAAGSYAYGRSQWHQKTSWRRTSPNPEREREINWRLQSTSLGLVGEIGIHQIDGATWLFNKRPVAVSGFGAIRHWKDGRDVADTVLSTIHYADGLNNCFDASLANSFDSDLEMYYGTFAAIMLRGNRAWMFKEVDSPLLGWEVYARKDSFYRETGIALVANATKLKAQGDNPLDDAASQAPSFLYFALEAFVTNSLLHQVAVADFAEFYDISDREALAEYLSDIEGKKLPYASYKEGYESAVTVIKANEAIQKGDRIELNPDWFELG